MSFEARRIYQEVAAVLQARYDVTGVEKHRVDRLLMNNDCAWLAMPDGKKKHSGKCACCTIFTLSMCQRILRDKKCLDVRVLRDRIAAAIAFHRSHALGFDDAINPLSNDSPSAVEERRPLKRHRYTPPSSHNQKELTTEQQGRVAIEFATSKAQLAPAERLTFSFASDVLKKVLKEGVDKKSITEKQELCLQLGNTCSQHPELTRLVKVAYGIIIYGDPWGEVVGSQVIDEVVDVRLRSAYPADGDRICFALGIVRRCIIPGATLDSVLASCPGPDRLGKVLVKLHSWRMRVTRDGTPCIPIPWVVDLCNVAMRMLDDLI
jgi:hypothetical protein